MIQCTECNQPYPIENLVDIDIHMPNREQELTVITLCRTCREELIDRIQDAASQTEELRIENMAGIMSQIKEEV